MTRAVILHAAQAPATLACNFPSLLNFRCYGAGVGGGFGVSCVGARVFVPLVSGFFRLPATLKLSWSLLRRTPPQARDLHPKVSCARIPASHPDRSSHQSIGLGMGLLASYFGSVLPIIVSSVVRSFPTVSTGVFVLPSSHLRPCYR